MSGEETRSIPVIVEVELQEIGEWSTTEQAEAHVARALRLCYPEAPVRVVTAHMLPAPMGEALAQVVGDGPEGLVRRLNEMVADPNIMEFMAGMLNELGSAFPVPGEERAPDDLSELDKNV